MKSQKLVPAKSSQSQNCKVLFSQIIVTIRSAYVLVIWKVDSFSQSFALAAFSDDSRGVVPYESVTDCKAWCSSIQVGADAAQPMLSCLTSYQQSHEVVDVSMNRCRKKSCSPGVVTMTGLAYAFRFGSYDLFLQVFFFELSSEDMAALKSLNIDWRVLANERFV